MLLGELCRGEGKTGIEEVDGERDPGFVDDFIPVQFAGFVAVWRAKHDDRW